MKTKIYVRVGKSVRGHTRGTTYVDASKKVNHAPLHNVNGAVPTVAFAISLDVPDHLFTNAEKVIADLRVTAKKSIVNAEVEAP